MGRQTLIETELVSISTTKNRHLPLEINSKSPLTNHLVLVTLDGHIGKHPKSRKMWNPCGYSGDLREYLSCTPKYLQKKHTTNILKGTTPRHPLLQQVIPVISRLP